MKIGFYTFCSLFFSPFRCRFAHFLAGQIELGTGRVKCLIPESCAIAIIMQIFLFTA